MVKPDILLSTLNARYQHTAFGLKYIYANLDELRPRAQILEFTTQQSPREIAEKIIQLNPKIIGFGVYIWNTRQTQEVISVLKRVAPKMIVVIGGPEVSHESDRQMICQLADYTIRGEADFLFHDFCKNYLENSELPKNKWISGELPEITKIISPYSFYTDEDIRNRIIYVEASRGCPYQCEYCLSSLDKKVRNFDLTQFLSDIDQLIQRGARQFKFLDRTFNLSISTCSKILQFFLDRISLGLFIHFEMVPDRLPEELRDLIRRFPPGALQFEIGVQTWSPEVSKLVSRRQDYSKIIQNFQFLAQETGVHIHADLIAGLPGETLESFAHGFNSLLELNPHEIQLGLLKRLRGTPICRHDLEWKMIYQDEPPYLVLQTKTMSFETVQKLTRISKFWDLIGNSGNFCQTLQILRSSAQNREDRSFFHLLIELSEFLSLRHPQGNGISLLNLVESIWTYLTQVLKITSETARSVLIEDYSGKIKRDIPSFLRNPEASPQLKPTRSSTPKLLSSTPSRQRRHLAQSEATEV